MTAETRLLPEQFADLEPLARIWALPEANARYEQRLASTMDELQDFYDTVMPRGEALLEYLDQFPLDELPEEALNVARLLSSLSFVSFSVELFNQPKIPDSGATYVEWVRVPYS